MRRLLIRLNFALRRAVCYLFGHVKVDVSLYDVGLRQCVRCLRITDHKTVRRRVTRGEIERRMADHPPTGFRFINCNWKKRKARFVSPTGKLTFVSF